MEHRDHNYYEANSADVNLEEITSSAKNAKNLQRLRDGDPRLIHILWSNGDALTDFCIGEGDDLGWLGYFIGKSEYLQSLDINYLPDGEQQMHAFSEGIARNQSIRNINIRRLNNDGFTSMIRGLHSFSQLEGLTIGPRNNVDPDGRSELRTLLESGVCKLKRFCLHGNNYIGNEGMGVLSNGLIGIGSSLKYLSLSHNSIGNEGLSSLVDALQTCTGLETLHLSGNGFSFSEGIARNQSIRNINIRNLNNDTFTSIMRALHSASQLEELDISNSSNVDPDGWSELRTLLESGVCKLKQLCLYGNNYIGNEGMGVLSNGLIGIGSSLKCLYLSDNSIGNEGLSSLVDALQTCTCLETLHLSRNDFSSAAAGLGSLSSLLQRYEMNLKHLNLSNCRINDEGLRALSQGAANHCEEIDLDGNESITSTGLSYLSNATRSDSCRVETLWLQGIPIEDDGMEVLAQGLVGNQSLTRLYLVDLDEGMTVTSAGWVAFSTALCDTSSVNSTYLSNHTIHHICIEDDEETIPRDISLYLQLNKEHPQYVARCKIIMSHRHLDMTPLLHWGLKCLPLAVAWFERSKPCTTLTIYDEDPDLRRRVLNESDEAFESRKLTAMYEFVRGMPMEVVKSRHGLALAATYDKKIARIEEEKKIALEQRDRKIEQLEEEITRLRGLYS